MISTSNDGDSTSTLSSNEASSSTSSSGPRLEINEQNDKQRLLTTDEVAALLQVHPLTVRRAVAGKKLRCIRLGRSTRFRREDVAKYVAQMSTTGPRKAATSASAKQHAPKRSSRK